MLAATFVLSGFAKAADPMGMFYKLNAYFAHWGHPFAEDSVILTGVTVVLSAAEFILGIYLLLGIRRRFTTTVVAAFMALMTALTVYIYIYNPVPDCGCFGTALTLTNGETLAKNIVLLLASLVLLWKQRYILRIISERNQWITSMYSLVYIVLLNLLSIHYLPVLDFTDFRVGTDMRKAYFEPNETTPAALINFGCTTMNGELCTDSLLLKDGYTFVLTLSDLSTADDGCNDRINDLYDACRDSSYGFFALASYNSDSTMISRWIDRTGAAYPIFLADADQLKAMVRSNPGLLLLKDGVITGKWSNNNLPQFDVKGEWGNDSADRLARLSIVKLLLWFIIPLLGIILLDRIWIGSKFYRHHIFKKRLKRQENEKENCSR